MEYLSIKGFKYLFNFITHCRILFQKMGDSILIVEELDMVVFMKRAPQSHSQKKQEANWANHYIEQPAMRIT
jgi:hypothetical protein